jgi:hypothetical protein
VNYSTTGGCTVSSTGITATFNGVVAKNQKLRFTLVNAVIPTLLATSTITATVS